MESSEQKSANPDAKIGFVIFYPFQFYVFKNIYKLLADQAEFIIDGGRFYPIAPAAGLVEDCVRFLSEQGVSFRVLNHEDYKDPEFLHYFFSHYKVLVALWRSGCLVIPHTDHIRKVHMNYGAGKELTMFWSRHRYWDLYLCVNKRVYEIVRLFTWVEIIGYPKFDEWFKGIVNKKTIAAIKQKLDFSKKTVLYLPTHGDLASIDDLAGELQKISKIYNVLVKVHYYTPREEKDRFDKLNHPGIILYKDDTDLLPLLKVADVVVSDNSSAIFDAILADKPVLVADFLPPEYLDNGHRKVRFFTNRIPEGALTYSQSIEQLIKRNGSVAVFKKPEEFKKALENALLDEKKFKLARKKLRKELFAFNDGKCSQRAASAIRKILHLKQLPEKPILYHVFESEYQTYAQYSGLLANSGESQTNYLSEYYIQRMILGIKSLPLFPRIWFILQNFFKP